MTIDNIKFRAAAFMACLFVMVPVLSWAQETWEKEGEGEIRDVEIEIVKTKKITLPKANRNFEKVPPRPFEPIEPAITYDELKGFKLQPAPYQPVLRPLKLKQEDISRSYGNYLSGGFGNYASLFGEAAVTTRRNRNGMLGAHLFHRSYGRGPVNDDFSGSSQTNVDLFGKRMWKDITLSGQAAYSRRAGYFFGYTPVPETNKDNIRQVYDQLDVQAGVENTRKGDFNYQTGVRYSYLQDHYAANEGELTLQASTDAKLGGGKLIISGDYILINRQDAVGKATSRNLLHVRPAYQFSPLEALQLTVGANIAWQTDTYQGSKQLHFYPNIKADYTVSDAVTLFGNITGDIDKVDLHTLSAENMWINPNIDIYHTNRALDFSAGVKGTLGDRFTYAAGVGMATLKNYYYYLNIESTVNGSGQLVPVMTNKFSTTYDTNTRRINPFGELGYEYSEVLKFSIRGDYYSYQTETLTEAWHRPTYKVRMTGRYNAYGKIMVDAGLVAQGGMRAFDPAVSGGVVTLDPAFDLMVHGRYFVSKQFSVFLHLDNILGQKYPLYMSYPARGFQMLGGVSWGFQ